MEYHPYSINPNRLTSVFFNTTNSYKYLFFMCILRQLMDSNFNKKYLDFEVILDDMLDLAAWPLLVYKLSFGPNDKIIDKIHLLNLPNSTYQTGNNFYSNEFDYKVERNSGILKYVPSRFIRPWFDVGKTSDVPDYKVDQIIEEQSKIRFLEDYDIPLYQILNNGIELHPLWINYLKDNYKLIKTFVELNWLQWLQIRNPLAPALTEKLGPPKIRRSLTLERFLWKKFINNRGITCIYTGEELNEDFALDHFLPRSFIGHDQIWNLIPVSNIINSQKSDKIPLERYVDKLSSTHALAFEFWDNLNIKGWVTIRQQYITSLRIPIGKSNCWNNLHNAYISTYKPLMEIAEIMGFEGCWSPLVNTNKNNGVIR